MDVCKYVKLVRGKYYINPGSKEYPTMEIECTDWGEVIRELSKLAGVEIENEKEKSTSLDIGITEQEISKILVDLFRDKETDPEVRFSIATFLLHRLSQVEDT